MKKEDLVRLGLDEETAKKVAEASSEELKGFIPKTRFDEVNNEKKKLELDIRDRDGQLEKLKNSTGDVEAMKKQIEDLQKINRDAADAHAAEIRQMKINNAIESALVNAKAKNTKAVKALLNGLDKAKLKDDGTIEGLNEQITALKKSDSYLFDGQSQIKGAKPADGVGGEGKSADTSKMTYSELLNYIAENPDVKLS